MDTYMNVRVGSIIGLLALTVGLTAALFLSLNFRIAQSDTASEYRLATYRRGNDQAEAMQIGEGLNVAVNGHGDFVERLRQALMAELSTANVFSSGELLAGTNAQDDTLHLLVELEQETMFWSPFYASSQLTAAVIYASDGDLSWRGMSPVVMESGDALLIWADGELQISDTSAGLISRPSYQRMLADRTAVEIVKMLASIASP
jgi:hypothetical protein